jgi:hypothetical protein
MDSFIMPPSICYQEDEQVEVADKAGRLIVALFAVPAVVEPAHFLASISFRMRAFIEWHLRLRLRVWSFTKVIIMFHAQLPKPLDTQNQTIEIPSLKK